MLNTRGDIGAVIGDFLILTTMILPYVHTYIHMYIHILDSQYILAYLLTYLHVVILSF